MLAKIRASWVLAFTVCLMYICRFKKRLIGGIIVLTLDLLFSSTWIKYDTHIRTQA